MARRGIKICPKCNTENGVRTFVCKCNYNFFPGQERKTIISTARPASERKKGRGIKECPDCKALYGARTLTCECGFDFTSIVKKVASKKQHHLEKKVSEGHAVSFEIPAYVAPKRFTPIEHAKRILEYGKQRASLLFQFAKIEKKWSHVDWAAVEKGLAEL
jgi:hypothetical protein